MTKLGWRPTQNGTLLWGCLLLITTVVLLTIFFPWHVFGTIMMVVNSIPDMRSDSDYVWQTIGPGGPGYENLEILGREGEYGGMPGVTVYFRIDMDVTEGVLVCSGKVRAFRSDPSYIGISWETESCENAHDLIRMAHNALKDSEVSPSSYSRKNLESIVNLLCHWVEERKIGVESIKSWDVRDLVKDALAEER